jgi:gamma-glutamyltranspeptidase/glutathione hydrolase
MRKIAADGKSAFYEGEIAHAIASVIQQAGGCLTIDDLSAHRSTWEHPISTTYRGLRVWECPPNGQGLTALLALNILEGFDLSEMEPLSLQRLHIMVEAIRLAFADSRWYVADPAFGDIPLNQLLSKGYASQRRKLIDPYRATLDNRQGSPTLSSDTVYLSVVDGYGNACSFINSNYLGFGTGIVPSGWGFSLQNRGANFSLDPSHPNALAPGKRPYHTIIPSMVTVPAGNSGSSPQGEQLYACFGVMGGFMQPQGHVQVLTGLIDDGLNPQSALDRPRFCIVNGEAGGATAFEDGISPDTLQELSLMGHPIEPASSNLFGVFGLGQVILRNAENGVLCAGSDHRADGCAMTY